MIIPNETASTKRLHSNVKEENEKNKPSTQKIADTKTDTKRKSKKMKRAHNEQNEISEHCRKIPKERYSLKKIGDVF